MRPLLAATLTEEKFDKLQFPYLLSPKIDGIRAVMRDGQAISRSGLPLPSKQASALFGRFSGMDGELIIGNPWDENLFNTTQSSIMSVNKPGVLSYHVFDTFAISLVNQPFSMRFEVVKAAVQTIQSKFDVAIKLVEHTLVKDLKQLLVLEDKYLEMGYEGVMLRNPNGRYKFGRATDSENNIWKLKRFDEFEAPIIGFIEQVTNTNALEVDPLGYAKRSTAKDGMVCADTLGKFVVDYQGEHLNVSCGVITHKQRQDIWDNQHKYLGKEIVCRHMGQGLSGYRPRHIRCVGFREDGR